MLNFFVVGCGSIGERHIRNLKSFFPIVDKIFAYDISQERLRLMRERYGVEAVNSIDEVLSKKSVDAALVCTPPNSHVPMAMKFVENNLHVFVEKPLSNQMKDVDKLLRKAEKKKLNIMVGYNLRFHPGIRLVKKLVDEKQVGKILSAIVEAGQYLPDWRPWQDYRKSYTAIEKMGGGVILDGSHEIDYIRWLLGDVKELSCFAGKISSLEVETEDTAEIILRFKSGAIAGIHLDFVQRGYARSCKLIGEEGNILWSYPEKTVKVYLAEGSLKTFRFDDFEPNQMYVKEMEHFINCVQGLEKPLVDGWEGKATLLLALAAKKSAKERKVIVFE